VNLNHQKELITACLLTNDYKQAQKLLVIWSQYPIKGYLFLIIKLNKMITLFGLRSYQLLKYEIDNFRKISSDTDSKKDEYEILLKLFKSHLSKENISKQTIDFAIEEIRKIRNYGEVAFDYYELNYLHWLTSYKSYSFSS